MYSEAVHLLGKIKKQNGRLRLGNWPEFRISSQFEQQFKVYHIWNS
jgi:hypothetical protein